jgi:hypothetical protein
MVDIPFGNASMKSRQSAADAALNTSFAGGA